MASPNNLRYTEEHEWVLFNDGIATIGITDHAQSELGEIVYVEVETVDETLEKNEVFGTVEAVKTTSDLYLPVTGKVIEFNSALDESDGDQPELINTDPYGEGWIIKVEVSDPSEIEGLLTAEQYEALIS